MAAPHDDATGAASFVPEFSVSQPQWGSRGPARSLTATGVEGDLGASYTVYETNWNCAECKGGEPITSKPDRDHSAHTRAPIKRTALIDGCSGWTRI